MKAVVVTDQAAGTAGMTLVERPKPQATINNPDTQILGTKSLRPVQFAREF